MSQDKKGGIEIVPCLGINDVEAVSAQSCIHFNIVKLLTSESYGAEPAKGKLFSIIVCDEEGCIHHTNYYVVVDELSLADPGTFHLDLHVFLLDNGFLSTAKVIPAEIVSILSDIQFPTITQQRINHNLVKNMSQLVKSWDIELKKDETVPEHT